MSPQETYDVVIVGAGLAGLSVAYRLKDFQTLILEQEKYIGGRILTRSYEHMYYDLGAVLGYNQDCLPVDSICPEPVEESNPIALFFDGKIHTGDSVLECIRGVFPDNSKELSAILDFKNGQTNLESLRQDSRDILNAFFRVIHAGEIETYLPERQQDAFIRYRPMHYKTGNGSLIKAYSDRIHARIHTDTEVLSIQRNHELLQTACRKNGEIIEVRSHSVVIATPAAITARLLEKADAQHLHFFQSIRYARFTVVVIGMGEYRGEHDFSYMVTSGMPMNTIYKMTFPDDDRMIFFFYYCDSAAKKHKDLTDEQLVQLSLDSTQNSGLNLLNQEILFTDVYRWEHGGTIISPDVYSSWREDYLQPAPGIFVAGDYLHKEFPYGMDAAVTAGIETAREVRTFLEDAASL